jgi:hypothetical protein
MTDIRRKRQSSEGTKMGRKTRPSRKEDMRTMTDIRREETVIRADRNGKEDGLEQRR